MHGKWVTASCSCSYFIVIKVPVLPSAHLSDFRWARGGLCFYNVTTGLESSPRPWKESPFYKHVNGSNSVEGGLASLKLILDLRYPSFCAHSSQWSASWCYSVTMKTRDSGSVQTGQVQPWPEMKVDDTPSNGSGLLALWCFRSCND